MLTKSNVFAVVGLITNKQSWSIISTQDTSPTNNALPAEPLSMDKNVKWQNPNKLVFGYHWKYGS